MQPANIVYPAFFLFRKYTLLILIAFDLIMILYNTFTWMNNAEMFDDHQIVLFKPIQAIENFTQINQLQPMDTGDLGSKPSSWDNGPGMLNGTEHSSNTTKLIWMEVLQTRVYQRPKVLAQVLANLFAYVVCLIGFIGVLRDNYYLTVIYAWFGCFSLFSTIIVYFWSWTPQLLGKILSNILFLILLFLYIKDLAAIRLQMIPNVIIVS